MRAVLINPPKCFRERTEIAPPLGPIRLAAEAHRAGIGVAIEDFNLLYHLSPSLRSDFYAAAVDRLLCLDADVYGFTSMAVDSHVALELARRVKAARQDAVIVCGGPHFSSVKDALPSVAPWVDEVITGEGERAFVAYLRRRAGLPLESPAATTAPGLFLRESERYDLVDLPAYFAVNPHRTVNVEVGRGCRYRCAFCYSTTFYRDRRDYAIDAIITELTALCALGAKRAFFVGDNLLNDPEWAAALCSALEEARLGLTWCCYVTLPDLTPALTERLARAGCTQVFMGIDAVGRAAERSFHKRFAARDDEFRGKLRALRDAGIRPTCGFILAPPSHPASADREATLRAAVHARLEGADVAVNALSLYGGTHAYGHSDWRFEADPLQARLLMDVPPIVQDNPLAAAAPQLFPFHARYTDAAEWREFLSFAHAAHTLINGFADSFSDRLSTPTDARVDVVCSIVEQVMERVGDLAQYPAEIRRRVEQAAMLDLTGGASAEAGDTSHLSTSSNRATERLPVRESAPGEGGQLSW